MRENILGLTRKHADSIGTTVPVNILFSRFARTSREIAQKMYQLINMLVNHGSFSQMPGPKCPFRMLHCQLTRRPIHRIDKKKVLLFVQNDLLITFKSIVGIV